MNDRREEYFPNHNDTVPAPGAKVFSLTKAPDPDMQKILDAKKLVDSEPRERLSTSMKNFFKWVLDRSLDRNAPGWKARGSIIISDGFAGHFFQVSDRTIYTWKMRLEDLGHLWLSYERKTNMKPITIYNITALVPRPHVRQDKDGIAQNGATREPGFGGAVGARKRRDDDNGGGGGGGGLDPFGGSPGAREPGQRHLPLPGSRSPKPPEVYEVSPGGIILLEPMRLKLREPSRSLDRGSEPESPVFGQISAQSRKELRVSPEKKIGSEPIKRSAESRREDRVSPEKKIGSEPKKRSAESRSLLREPAEANFRQRRQVTPTSDSSFNNGEGEPTPDLEFEEWKSGLKGLFPSRLNALRAEFQAKLGLERDAERRAFYKRRIEAIDELRHGGRPPKPAPAPRPAQPAAPAEPEPLTDEELIAHAAWCRERNKPHLISPEMKRRLAALEAKERAR